MNGSVAFSAFSAPWVPWMRMAGSVVVGDVEGGPAGALVAVGVHERVAGEAAPCRHADAGGGVVGVDFEHLARLEVLHRVGDERREIDAGQAGCVEAAMLCGHGFTARNVWPNTS
jgi:hypothetical protein